MTNIVFTGEKRPFVARKALSSHFGRRDARFRNLTIAAAFLVLAIFAGVIVALANGAFPAIRDLRSEVRSLRRRKRGRAFKAFVFGLLIGFATLITAALMFGPKG